jgi:hypothetical protein
VRFTWETPHGVSHVDQKSLGWQKATVALEPSAVLPQRQSHMLVALQACGCGMGVWTTPGAQ